MKMRGFFVFSRIEKKQLKLLKIRGHKFCKIKIPLHFAEGKR
jgi:hypothetical protein